MADSVVVTSAPPIAPAEPRRAWIITAFLIVYIVWGSTYLAMRIAVHTLPAFAFAGIRFVIAGLLVIAWFYRPGAARPPLTRRHVQAAATTGILLLTLGNGSMAFALQTVPSGVAALVIATVPLFIVLLTWLREGTRPTLGIALGLVAGLGGVAVLLTPALSQASTITPLSALMMLSASFFWSVGSLRGRDSPALPEAPLLLSGLQMLTGGLALFVLATVTGEWSRLSLAAFTPQALAAIAYLVIMGSLVGYSAFSWLLKVVPPARVATYSYVNPVVAVILGATLGGEPITPRVLLAATIILGAVVMITRGTAAPRKAA